MGWSWIGFNTPHDQQHTNELGRHYGDLQTCTYKCGWIGQVVFCVVCRVVDKNFDIVMLADAWAPCLNCDHVSWQNKNVKFVTYTAVKRKTHFNTLIYNLTSLLNALVADSIDIITLRVCSITFYLTRKNWSRSRILGKQQNEKRLIRSIIDICINIFKLFDERWCTYFLCFL